MGRQRGETESRSRESGTSARGQVCNFYDSAFTGKSCRSGTCVKGWKNTYTYVDIHETPVENRSAAGTESRRAAPRPVSLSTLFTHVTHYEKKYGGKKEPASWPEAK